MLFSVGGEENGMFRSTKRMLLWPGQFDFLSVKRSVGPCSDLSMARSPDTLKPRVTGFANSLEVGSEQSHSLLQNDSLHSGLCPNVTSSKRPSMILYLLTEHPSSPAVPTPCFNSSLTTTSHVLICRFLFSFSRTHIP